MTDKEKAQQIEAIYNEAIEKLSKLGKERQDIINGYVKELEAQKIDVIRASILSKE